MDDEDSSIPVESRFRSYLDDNLDKQRDSDAVAALAYINNEDARQLYLRYRQAFSHKERYLDDDVVEQMPDEFRQTQVAQRIIKKYASEQARRAVSQADERKMAWQQGVTGMESLKDGSYYSSLKELWHSDDEDTQLNLMIYAPLPPAGPTGTGKTDFAYRILEEALIEYPNIKISTNVESDDFRTTKCWSDTKNWIESEEGEKVVLIDEAAQVLQFSDQKAGKQLSQMIKLMRKHSCNLILIAHTGVDIPRDIRRQVLMARKMSKKQVRIGQGIEEQTGGEYVIKNILLEMQDIRQTRLEYDTSDTAEYTFDDQGVEDKEDRNSLIEKAQSMRDDGMSVREIAEEIDRSKSWVSDKTTN